MRLVFFAFISLCCQVCISQRPKWGNVEIYGNRSVDANTIYAALNLKQGDSILIENFKKEKAIETLKQIPGVKYATVAGICCGPTGNGLYYIGIGETDSVIIKHRTEPTQNTQLPDSIMAVYHHFNEKLSEGVRKGENSEDDSNGYGFFNYEPTKEDQDKLIKYASTNLPILVRVLQNSRYAEQRAAAATMIAYTNEKKKIASFLLFAVDDADDGVRNNAIRALGILAGYANSHKELKINIPYTPFLQLMNSIVWTDRNKGSSVLVRLCESRDPQLLKKLKEQVLPSIIEMARWRDRGHAYFSFMILGYMAGMETKSLVDKNFSADYDKEIDLMIEKILQKEK